MEKKPKNNRFELPSKEESLKMAEKIIEAMTSTEGMTLQDATGVSDEALEEIYALAYGYYDQGKLREAASLFQFLASAAPANYKYVLGLAASFHQMGEFNDAVLGFYIAANIEPENPIPAYYMADSFLKLNELEHAKEALEVTIEICEGKAEYKELKERCELLLKPLKINK